MADFGLAVSGHADANAGGEGYAVGQAGAFAYQSPENALGLPYNGKNDIWALGCMLSEMLTLVLITERLLDVSSVFAQHTQLVEQVINESIILDASLGSLVCAMLETDPSQRLDGASVQANLQAAPVNDKAVPQMQTADLFKELARRGYAMPQSRADVDESLQKGPPTVD